MRAHDDLEGPRAPPPLPRPSWAPLSSSSNGRAATRPTHARPPRAARTCTIGMSILGVVHRAGLEPLPAAPATVAVYLSALADAGRRPTSISAPFRASRTPIARAVSWRRAPADHRGDGRHQAPRHGAGAEGARARRRARATPRGPRAHLADLRMRALRGGLVGCVPAERARRARVRGYSRAARTG